MGLFSTSINYDAEKVTVAIDSINSVMNYLSTAKANLYSAYSIILSAKGYDLVEQAGAPSISTSDVETIHSACKTAISEVIDSISEKCEKIEAYDNAEGLEKAILFADIKTLNLREDVSGVIDSALDTGATILNGAVSILKGAADVALDVVDATGTVLCDGAYFLLSSIANGVNSLSAFLTGGNNTATTSSDESTATITDNDTTSDDESQNTATSIFSSLLSNIQTATKSIDVSNVKEGTNVGNAIQKYLDEINNANYVTISENLFTTTTETTINGQKVLLTHVVINDGSQINGEPANGSYASGLEKSSSAASRLSSSILINGSHFSYSDGSEDLKGANSIVIVNGEIKQDGVSGGNELLVDSSGNIFNSYGKTAQELVDSGVKYSYSCHSTQVIENGDTSPSYRETNQYKRTVIGQTQACEYYIVTDETYNNNLSDTAEYLKSLGVTNAYSLDQGGSVTLVRDDTVINNPSDENGERSVGDFLYFTDSTVSV